MAITNSDIKLFQAQNNTDDPNGGGTRTNVVVADGQVNNLFGDISRLDSVSGNLSFRKVFPTVDTQNRDIYQGAHAIIRREPMDDRVEAFLFYTNSATDTRSDAVEDVESYVTQTVETLFYPFGTQSQGSSTISVLQQLSEPVPVVGAVYAIRTSSGTSDVQYIRVSGLQSSEINLVESTINYTRRNVIMTIEQPLEFEFIGSTSPTGRNINQAVMFETAQSSTARFYGTKTLTANAAMGATSVNVGNTNGQLVPASNQRTPITTVPVFRSQSYILPNTEVRSRFNDVTGYRNDATNTLPSSVSPGTFVQTNTGSGISDNGEGSLIVGGQTVGTIDYATGTFFIASSDHILRTSDDFSYTPATRINGYADQTSSVEITAQNQSNVYVVNLPTVPSNGTLQLDYRTNNQWVSITANPDGSIGGGSGRGGSGTVTDTGTGTATLNVTLSALPDVGSRIILSWSTISNYTDVTSESSIGMFYTDLPHTRIRPTGFSVTLGFNTVSSDANGRLTNSAGTLVGYLDKELGRVYIGLGIYALGSTTVRLNYSYADAEPDESTNADIETRTFINNTLITGNLGLDDIPSLRITATVNYGVTGGTTPNVTREFYVDGNNIIRHANDGLNYGTITISSNSAPDFTNALTRINIIPPTVTRVGQQVPLFRLVSTSLNCTFRQSPIPDGNYNQSVSVNTSSGSDNYKLLYVMQPHIVSSFTFVGGSRSSAFNYVVSNNEIRNPDNVLRGSYDPMTGFLLFDNYDVFNISTQATDNTLLSGAFIQYNAGRELISDVVFRPNANVIDPTTVTVSYVNDDGDTVSVAPPTLQVNATNYDIRFNTGGNGIRPATATYNAVTITTLPIDPALLGINPVRLPPDGQVPLFQPATTCVIFEEMETDISGTPTAGQVITLGRTGQAYIEVVDVNGQRLAYNQFTTDRDAGTVTFASPLSLIDRNGDALTAPYTVIDRYEDMLAVVSTTANGDINLSGALSRTYTADSARIASALVWGDIGAALTLSFSQQTFTTWSDERNTDVISAQYDFTNNPLQVLNANAVTERWAIVFLTSTTVEIRGENLGVIATGLSITSNIAPTNPSTGQPYFTIASAGWGTGWVTSNVLRFNTRGGDANMWIIRTVQAGALTESTDEIDVEIRGDIS